MEGSFPLLLALVLTISGMFGGPSGRGAHTEASDPLDTVSRASSLQEKDKEKAKEKKPPILCSWIAYGRQETMCIRDDMSAAQKKCNEYATKQLGEPAQCSCTGDQSYIQDACD